MVVLPYIGDWHLLVDNSGLLHIRLSVYVAPCFLCASVWLNSHETPPTCTSVSESVIMCEVDMLESAAFHVIVIQDSLHDTTKPTA